MGARAKGGADTRPPLNRALSLSFPVYNHNRDIENREMIPTIFFFDINMSYVCRESKKFCLTEKNATIFGA